MANENFVLSFKNYQSMSNNGLKFLILDRLNRIQLDISVKKCKKQIEVMQQELNRRNAV